VERFDVPLNDADLLLSKSSAFSEVWFFAMASSFFVVDFSFGGDHTIL
jgi:hypothetical protein